MTKLIRLLSLVLLLVWSEGLCSDEVRSLARTSTESQEIIETIPRGFLLEDQHHDLDKFAGEWEGTGFGGYQWRTRIAVQKKANCYNSYWADALGLELSIKKDGKAAITPTGNLIPGTSFILGWGLRWEREKGAVDPNIYKVLFSYRKADQPYQGSVELRLYINATQ